MFNWRSSKYITRKNFLHFVKNGITLLKNLMKGVAVLEVIIQEPKDGENEQIIIICHEISPELLRLIDSVKTGNSSLVAYEGKEFHSISTSDVLYIETVDNKTFLYCENTVYESKQKLYELEKALTASAFLRISKSAIVNLSKIKSLTTALYGRLEAHMVNGEIIVVSRSYVDKLKRRLGV